VLPVGVYTSSPRIDHVLIGVDPESQLKKQVASPTMHVEQPTVLEARISGSDVIDGIDSLMDQIVVIRRKQLCFPYSVSRPPRT
jgi:hypothetical protein